MDTTSQLRPVVALGLTDAMHAARVEARRLMQETAGDLVAEQKALLERLTEADLITPEEADTLLHQYVIGYEAGESKGEPTRAYLSRGRFTTRWQRPARRRGWPWSSPQRMWALST